MLTLRRISSTVIAVRLDTKCCNIMFAATPHGRCHMVRWHSFGARLGGGFAAPGRRWSTPLAGG